MQRRRGNGRRPPAVVNRVRRRGRSQRIEHLADFRGLTVRGSADPPRVILSPWNSLVVVWLQVNGASPTNECVTNADIAAHMKTQLGISSFTGEFIFRIERADLWHIIPNGELNNEVQCDFMGLIDPSSACDSPIPLAAITDYGTPALNAHVHFIWPRTHASIASRSIYTNPVIRMQMRASQQILVHMHILYNFPGAVSSRSELRVENIVDDLSVLSLDT
jgi:hypothetical protein